MTETLIESRCNPKYKSKSQNEILKDNTPTNLHSNLQSLKQN